jgi:hypothetical protein
MTFVWVLLLAANGFFTWVNIVTHDWLFAALAAFGAAMSLVGLIRNEVRR